MGIFPQGAGCALVEARPARVGRERGSRTGGPQRYVGLHHLAALLVDPRSTIPAPEPLPALFTMRIRLFLSACQHALDRV